MLASMAISPDTRRIATLTNNKITIWEIASGRQLMTLPADGMLRIEFSADGRSLIGREINTQNLMKPISGAVIWRGATDEEVQKQRGH